MSTTWTTHRGGCAFCHHLQEGQCHHSAYHLPVDYHQAREPGQPCGPRAVLWEAKI